MRRKLRNGDFFADLFNRPLIWTLSSGAFYYQKLSHNIDYYNKLSLFSNFPPYYDEGIMKVINIFYIYRMLIEHQI